MNLGIDVDGVLAEFNSAYVRKITEVCGGDRPVSWNGQTAPSMEAALAEAWYPPVWDYPEDCSGFQKAEISKVWKEIRGDAQFWQRLDPYPDTLQALDLLNAARVEGHDVYFISHRAGKFAKRQTEWWLERYGMQNPTVLLALAEDKPTIARALKIDMFVEDKLPTVNALAGEAREEDRLMRTYLVTRPWNRGAMDVSVIEVGSVLEALGKELC